MSVGGGGHALARRVYAVWGYLLSIPSVTVNAPRTVFPKMSLTYMHRRLRGEAPKGPRETRGKKN